MEVGRRGADVARCKQGVIRIRVRHGQRERLLLWRSHAFGGEQLTRRALSRAWCRVTRVRTIRESATGSRTVGRGRSRGAPIAFVDTHTRSRSRRGKMRIDVS